MRALCNLKRRECVTKPQRHSRTRPPRTGSRGKQFKRSSSLQKRAKCLHGKRTLFGRGFSICTRRFCCFTKAVILKREGFAWLRLLFLTTFGSLGNLAFPYWRLHGSQPFHSPS